MIPSYTTNNNTKTQRTREIGRGEREKKDRENRSSYSVITGVKMIPSYTTNNNTETHRARERERRKGRERERENRSGYSVITAGYLHLLEQ